MDDTTEEMVMTAYDETVAESLARGLPRASAHAEGLTAAAMCLAAMAGMNDEEARRTVAGMRLGATA